MMFFHRKKAPALSPEHIEQENKKADEQVEAAQRELSLAKEMARDVRRIRLENNFMNDFREALGGGHH